MPVFFNVIVFTEGEVSGHRCGVGTQKLFGFKRKKEKKKTSKPREKRRSSQSENQDSSVSPGNRLGRLYSLIVSNLGKINVIKMFESSRVKCL